MKSTSKMSTSCDYFINKTQGYLVMVSVSPVLFIVPFVSKKAGRSFCKYLFFVVISLFFCFLISKQVVCVFRDVSTVHFFLFYCVYFRRCNFSWSQFVVCSVVLLFILPLVCYVSHCCVLLTKHDI